MIARDDSIRALGKTNINVDKPLRDDIRQLANSNGMTIVEYLRAKVKEDKRANPQAVMTSVSNPQSRLERKIDTLIDSIQAIVPDADKPENVVEFVARMMLAFSSLKTFTDKDYRYSEAKKLADDSYRTAEAITNAFNKALQTLKDDSAAKQAELKLQES